MPRAPVQNQQLKLNNKHFKFRNYISRRLYVEWLLTDESSYGE